MHSVAKQGRQQHQMDWRHHASLALRVLAGIGGGFACTVALVSVSARLLVQLIGLASHEAVLIACMLGFVIYLGLLLWAFVEPRLWRLCLLLLLGIASDLALQLGPPASLPLITGAG